MIGRDHIDRTVSHCFDERSVIDLAAQRRIHLQVRIVGFGDVLIAEHQMMRRCFAGDLHPARFSFAHQIKALLRGEMLNMDRTACQLGKSDIALNLNLFACRWRNPASPSLVETGPSFTWPLPTKPSS